jgi:hypothetical protein
MVVASRTEKGGSHDQHLGGKGEDAIEVRSVVRMRLG